MTRKSSGRSSQDGAKRLARVTPACIPLHPIKSCNRIKPKERAFLDAAERGDKHTMVRCLQPPSPVNVNCTDMIGRSAIQIAVDNENVEIVEVLLKQKGIRIGDALLYAIREGVYKIVEMLIDHPSITPEMLGKDWSWRNFAGENGVAGESNDYSPDISPMILAAHCNQFEILQLLLMRGGVIDIPHQLSCSCRRCSERVNEDSLRHSIRRINTYRALASPAWVCLTSADPVLTAFRLSWELRNLALRENEFKDTYLELSDQCKKLSCSLLDQCRSTDEVIAVLNKPPEIDESEGEDRDTGGLLRLSRLKLAIKYEQKEFVAHPNCQQLLTSVWYEGLPSWRKRNPFTKFLLCLGLILIMPFMAAIYWLVPRSRPARLLRSPFMKFLYHSASFGVFLLLLIVTSVQVSSIAGRQRQRGPPPTEFEWLISIWVAGFIWSECKQLWEEGAKAYLRQWWNWLDFIMLSLYLTTITLRFLAYIQIESGRYGPRELDRKYWPLYDPTIVSEGLFAVANVFSFARIIFLCQAHQYLGPLQISLGCMLVDIAKFLLIFFLVITSFACGLNQLFWYYTPTIDGNATPFYSLESSYRTLYWSLFGMAQLRDIKVLDGQVFTEVVGELLFMAYQTMAVIVLINMLIAMMSNSFQEIENHADMEWKFARSKLWMGYFDEGSTLPPPFNLVISPKAVVYFARTCRDLVCACLQNRKSDKQKLKSPVTSDGRFPQEVFRHSEQSVFTIPSFDSVDSVTGAKVSRLSTYEEIMRRLVTRYIHQAKKQSRQNGVNEDDILEIKQDISSLRYELREDRLREAGRKESYLSVLRKDISEMFRDVLRQDNGNDINQRHMTSLSRRQVFARMEGVRSKSKTQDNFNENNVTFQNVNSQNEKIRVQYPPENISSYFESNNLTRLNSGDFMRMRSDAGSSHTSNSFSLPDITSDPYRSNGLAPYAPRATSNANLMNNSNRSDEEGTNAADIIDRVPAGSIIQAPDIECIRMEMMETLRREVREAARDVALNYLQLSGSGRVIPEVDTELYQTHLYTQL